MPAGSQRETIAALGEIEKLIPMPTMIRKESFSKTFSHEQNGAAWIIGFNWIFFSLPAYGWGLCLLRASALWRIV